MNRNKKRRHYRISNTSAVGEMNVGAGLADLPMLTVGRFG